MKEQTYIITEEQRIDMLDMLDLVEWALCEHAAMGINMPDDEARFARLWDALNVMAPWEWAEECGDGSPENPFTTPDLPEWYG